LQKLPPTDGAPKFIASFASNSDLAILSASLLGPLLYMMFREEEDKPETRIVSRFPSGLWFVMIIIACCILAAIIYGFHYLSSIHAFYTKEGLAVDFVSSNTISLVSWILFATVVLVITFASTIRNSIYTETPKTPRIMAEETDQYVEKFQAQNTATEADEFSAQLAAAQRTNN
jgi:acyl-CoA synthetase (AMP-forming)/AMP-acid ligase II